MSSFSRLRIGARLAAVFSFLILLMAAVAAIGAFEIRAVNRNVDDFSDRVVPSLEALAEMRTLVGDLRRLESQHLMVDSEGERSALQARIEKTQSALTEKMRAYEPLVADDEERKGLQALSAALTAYGGFWKRVQPLSDDPARASEARALLLGDSGQAYRVLVAAVQALWEHKDKLGEAAGAEAESTYRRAVLGMGAAALLAAVLSACLALAITRSITRPLQQAMTLAERIGSGDLTARVSVQGRDETAQLLRALAQMNERLVQIVSQVRSSSDSIATGSAQIATGNADLSQRTEEQASNLQQTAASMEELTSTVRHNSDTARQAAEMAGSAAQVAGEGGSVVGQVVATMEEISRSSRRIADIIGTIDGIAFQTNILALNAAVEAARAGEQGRGFAVVAGEVRSLAQRSAEAAREIKSLIGGSVEKVDAGSRLCEQAGRTMDDIVTQVQRVSQLIGEISSASVQQSQGIEQVGDAVAQLDQVTQQNAALVEESAAAAGSLQQQAGRLTQVVALFRLHEPVAPARTTA